MHKLVSDIEDSRWSFMDGYYIFGKVVWLTNKNETSKYKLIDRKGNVIDVKNDDFLVEC